MNAPPITQEPLHRRTEGRPAIAYAQCGQGPQTIFFLHGIGGNKDNWLAQLHYFAARGWRAVAWDVRGYGDSEDYEDEFRFEDISADLLRLMQAVGVRRAHFVGLSMGGRILMDFASRHAQRVDRLVICGAFPSFGTALNEAQREDYLRLRREPLLAGRSFQELAPQLIASLAGPDVRPSTYEALHASICQLRAPSYLKALKAAVYFDRMREIRGIMAPTLLLYAANDRLTPPEMGAQVQTMMPNAVLRVLPRCGHLMNLEAGELFNEAVQAFLCDEETHQREGEQ